MSDIQPGDVVVCVDDGPVKTIDGIREVAPRHDFAIANLRKGRLYRVSRVVPGKGVLGLQFNADLAGGWIDRFRKVKPADPEFIELLKRAHMPAPEKVGA